MAVRTRRVTDGVALELPDPVPADTGNPEGPQFPFRLLDPRESDSRRVQLV